jgi:hypothetical protein
VHPLLAPLGPPPDEAIYKDPDAVKAALQAHARDNGYGISVTSSEAILNGSFGGVWSRRFGRRDLRHIWQVVYLWMEPVLSCFPFLPRRYVYVVPGIISN